MQDRIALILLQRRNNRVDHPKRRALGYIMEGKIEEAIQETRLYDEWTVLPGFSKAYTMSDLRDGFEKYLKEFAK